MYTLLGTSGGGSMCGGVVTNDSSSFPFPRLTDVMQRKARNSWLISERQPEKSESLMLPYLQRLKCRLSTMHRKRELLSG